MAPSPLLEKVRACIRVRHYSPRAESTYVHRICRYILFSGKRHPAEIGSAEVREFLNDRAVQKKVAASTQNQALAAVLFADFSVRQRSSAIRFLIVPMARPSACQRWTRRSTCLGLRLAAAMCR